MLDLLLKTVSQILSPPLRAILYKSVALALALIAALAVGMQRLLSWLASSGGQWAETMLGPTAHTPLAVLTWIVSIAAGLGVVLGGIFLMPAVTSFVASLFVDDIAEQVERESYPQDAPGVALPLPNALWEGTKTALLTLLVYLAALPFLFIGGLGAVAFFVATAWLLGREYFELAAMRFRPAPQARALRLQHRTTVFIAGLAIAAFVSIPIVNLATPLFGMAFMVHLHKRLTARAPIMSLRSSPASGTDRG